jgi:uncharacterized protein YkwD
MELIGRVLGWFGLGRPEEQTISDPECTTGTFTDSDNWKFCLDMASAINRAREGAGLRPLHVFWFLYESALDKAQENASTGRRSQGVTVPCGAWLPIRSGSYLSYNCNASLDRVVAQLLDDPLTRDNLLDPRWTDLGAAVASDEDGRSFVVVEYGVYH